MKRRNFLKCIGGAGVLLSSLPTAVWGKETSAGVPQIDEKQDMPLLENTSANQFTFENFFEGDSNRFSKTVAQKVADRPGLVYNPLVMYGDIGVGKTHLLRAIENRIRVEHKSLNVLCAGAEEFVNDVVNAIRFDRMPDFRRKYMDVDVLLIDDIDYIAGKERSQEALLSIFDHLFESGRQMVMTSNITPKLIDRLDEKLMSRFCYGLWADIQPSEFSLRLAVVKEKARRDSIALPDDVASLIAELTSNVREANGAMVTITAYSAISGREISKPLALEVFQKKNRACQE